MALGDTDISITSVGTETGSSLKTVSGLVGLTGLNIYSRYSPGTLGVDASKNVTLTAPTSNYKLGDFRRYSHTTAKPTFQSIGTQSHVPASTTLTIVQPIAMNELNLWMFPQNGIDTGVTPNQYHLRINMYASSANRTSEASVLQTFYPINVNMVSHTPLAGHTRQPSYVMNTDASGNLITLTNVNCGSGTVTRYFDFFFCDSTGANRLVNFGNKSDGYVDITFREQVQPYLQPTGTISPVPSGATAAFPRIYTASTPKCSTVSTINLTQGGNTYSFYMGLHVVIGASNYLYATTASVNVRMTRVNSLGSENKIINSNVAFSNSAKTSFSGTLSGWATVGNTWQYDEVVSITVESANWDTSWGTGSIC